MEAGGFGRGELGDSGDLGKFAAFARRKCMGGWRFRLRGVGGLGRLGEVCGIRPEEVHGRLAVSAALTSLLCTLLRLQSRQLRPHTFHDRRVDFRRCHQALSAAARLFHCRGKRGVQATEAAGEARSVRISIPGTTRRSCPQRLMRCPLQRKAQSSQRYASQSCWWLGGRGWCAGLPRLVAVALAWKCVTVMNQNFTMLTDVFAGVDSKAQPFPICLVVRNCSSDVVCVQLHSGECRVGDQRL